MHTIPIAPAHHREVAEQLESLGHELPTRCQREHTIEADILGDLSRRLAELARLVRDRGQLPAAARDMYTHQAEHLDSVATWFDKTAKTLNPDQPEHETLRQAAEACGTSPNHYTHYPTPRVDNPPPGGGMITPKAPPGA